MTRKGRKRKHGETSRAVTKEREIQRIDRSTIVLDNGSWIPSVAEEFLIGYPDIEERMKKLDSTAALVGPFRKLKGQSDAEGIELLMLDREMTDLPEMQTFLKAAAGRYAFWRDTPSQTNPMIVFVDLKTVPEVTVVGNTMEHAVLDFCERALFFTPPDALKKARATVLGITEKDVPALELAARKVIRNRKEICIGGALGSGRVPIELDSGMIGYRELSTEASVTENLLRSLRLVGIKEHELRVGVVISNMYVETMECVEEGFYKNALDLGHMLFLANQETIFEPMCLTLDTAYRKQGHFDFIEILKLTLELREIPCV